MTIAGLSITEVVELALMLVVVGALAGFFAGIFGIGGGAILVPVFYECFRLAGVPLEVRMPLCIGTSLAIIIPTSIRSFRAHRARRDLPVEILRTWALPVTVGVLIGGVIAAVAPASIFKVAFVVIALTIGAKFLFGRESRKLGNTLPGPFMMNVYGLIIGLYSALMGVGGGSVSNAILVFYGQPIHAAVGIASGIGVLISIVGTISFMIAGWPHQAMMPALSIGFVSLIGFVLMAPITAYAAPLGARLAHALPKRQLEIAFGVFLWLVALRFIVSLI
jgi:uncharacterized membrane protein YfcA